MRYYGLCVPLLLAGAAQAQPTPGLWAGEWSAQITPREHVRHAATLRFEIGGTSLTGSFSALVSGTVTGAIQGPRASGRWVAGSRGGEFSLTLDTDGQGFTGQWGGEGGGAIRGLRSGAGRPEDCPTFLANYLLEDSADSVGQSCARYRPSSRAFGFSGDNDRRLESYLRARPELIGYRPAHSPIGAACRARLGADPRLAGLSPEAQAERLADLTAEYYWSRKRLADGVKAALENLAALDQILALDCAAAPPGRAAPTTLLSDLRCAELGATDGAPQLCDRLRTRCRQGADHGALIDNTELALHQIEALEARRQRGGLDAEQGRALEDMLRVLRGTARWVGGDYFTRYYRGEMDRCLAQRTAEACAARRPQLVCGGIRAEAAELRPRIRAQLERFQAAMSCLEGVGQDCAPRQVRETIALAPEFVAEPEEERMHEGDLTAPQRAAERDRIHANLLFSQVECRRALRASSDAINDAWKDFAVGSALTIATAGLGAVAGAARLSAAAGHAGRAAATGSRLSAVGARVAALGKFAPQVLELGLLGLDAADLASGIKEAVQSCSDAFARTGRLPVPGATTAECPGGQYEGAQLVPDYQSCVLRGVALQAGLGLLPALPAGVSRLLDRRTLSRAEALLGTLDEARRSAVLEVFRGRFARAGPLELEAAVSALERAGFSPDQIRRLFAELSPHSRVVGGRLVHGLEGRVLAHVRAGGHTVCVTEVAGEVVLQGCTSCAQLQRLFAQQLAGDPALARELEAIRRELMALGRSPATDALALPPTLRRRLETLGGQLGERRTRDFLDARGLARAPADQPALRQIVAAVQAGRLSPEVLDQLAAQADEVLWELDHHLRSAAGAADRNDPNFLPLSVAAVKRRADELAAMVDALSRGELSPEAHRALKAALMEQTQAALRRRSTFYGGSLDDIVHPELTFPRTTPELRARARAAGEYVDPRTGQRVRIRLGDAIDADHIYPIQAILTNPRLKRGFERLHPSLQRHVIHNPRNIQPLPPDLNRAKGGKLVDDWNRSEGGRLDPAYVNELRRQQREIEELLEKQIGCLFAHQDPARCAPP